MRIRQLGSTDSQREIRQHLTTFVINDTVAIDAGCLGLMSPVADQLQIKHLLLSHSHLDHLATLPIFLDNVFQTSDNPPTIYASRDVWYSLTHDVMNERLWPDLARIGSDELRFYTPVEISSEEHLTIDGLSIQPVSVDHLVPTLGFLIEDDRSAVVIASDTGPTERIWELASEPRFRNKLKMVFLECSFPDSHAWLAGESKHLCTGQFAAEIAKLHPGPPFTTDAVHLKAMLEQQIRDELMALNLPNLQIGGGEQTWEL